MSENTDLAVDVTGLKEPGVQWGLLVDSGVRG